MILPIVTKFWEELLKAYGDIDTNDIFTKPELCWEGEKIYAIQTKEDYIFDDAFWDVFHKYPFHICHVSYKEHELRFKIRDLQ